MRELRALTAMPAAARLEQPNTGDPVRALLVGIVREAIREELAEFCPPAAQAHSLLDRTGLAPALGVSLATLDRMRAAEGFPTVWCAEAPRFLLSDVIAFLQKGGNK
jgi:hypothetical protein